MASIKRPVKELEVERLAREAIVLHHELKSPLSADALNTAMGLYRKTFGTALTLGFLYRENSKLWNK